MDATVTETARIHPAACFCTASMGPFVDTGFNHPRYGRLYLCSKCVTAIGDAMGFGTPERVSGLEARIADLDQRVADAEESAEEARANRVVRVADLPGVLEVWGRDGAAPDKAA